MTSKYEKFENEIKSVSSYVQSKRGEKERMKHGEFIESYKFEVLNNKKKETKKYILLT